MKKIITLLVLSVTLIMASEYKVVFNLTTGDDTKVAKNLIKNIEILKEHYKSQKDTLQVAVVISGNSYKYFRNDKETPLDTKLQTLANQGVIFQVCSVGLKKHSIKISSLDKYVMPAFNRTAALIEFQNAGYAYIKID